MEHHIGFAPIPHAWKARMLTVKHQWCNLKSLTRLNPCIKISIPESFLFLETDFRKLVAGSGFAPLNKRL